MASKTEECIARLEEWILSGELEVGQRLPPERLLAARWSISRPVLHEAIVNIQNKGMLRIVPRHGVYVTDFRARGSAPMLSSLIAFPGNAGSPAFVQSLFELRMMLECEAARLAAVRHTDEQVQKLYSLANSLSPDLPIDDLSKIVFYFNHLIAIASQNLIYPLIINSFRDVYLRFAASFLTRYNTEQTLEWVRSSYLEITRAIEAHDGEAASNSMRKVIAAGEEMYKKNLIQVQPESTEETPSEDSKPAG